MTAEQSSRRIASQSTRDESRKNTSTQARHPAPEAAPFSFVDTFLDDLVGAAAHVGVDDIERTKAKLLLAMTLLDQEMATRGQR